MDYVIVGNSAAGVAAAESIRAVDEAGRITIIDAEYYHAYSRPLIAAHVAGVMDEADMRSRPTDFYTRNRLEPILGRRAVQLDAAARTLSLDDGRRISFDRLLIATGSASRFPDIPGQDLSGVFNFWTLDDSKAIAARIRLAAVRKAVVIGAGLVGLQAAYGLHAAGLEVTIIEMLDHILPRVLDKEAAQIVQRALESSGIHVITASAATELGGAPAGGVKEIVLANGYTLECGIVIKAAGVAPNIELVRGSPVAVERGILVDEFFETNVSGVYAAGDVAQTCDVPSGGTSVNANWPNAGEQGRVAGLNMAGCATPYAGSVGMTSIPVATENGTLAVFSMGLVEPALANSPNDDYDEDYDEDYDKDYVVRVRSHPEHSIYQKLVLLGDRLVGALFVGEINNVGLVNDLIRTQSPAVLVLDSLLDENAPFYYFRRERVHQATEGADLPWKLSLSSSERYEKRFDDAKWAEREQGQRKW